MNNIKLQVHDGDFLGIVGPNGSGKTTLVKLILGLLRPMHGEVKLYDQLASNFAQRHRIGYIAQRSASINLGFPATVQEVVAAGLLSRHKLFGPLKKLDRLQVDKTIELVGLSSYRRHLLGNLSGGQQQRVFIARALVCNPDLLIFDEPTVGVDAESVDRFYTLLEELHQCHKKTMVLVSHDIGVITTKVNKVACLNRELYFHGDCHEFISNQEQILEQAYQHSVQVLSHNH
nr:metal ABC transporter ATP-binding protein [Desulfurispira natronophila]